eukprot:221686_1
MNRYNQNGIEPNGAPNGAPNGSQQVYPYGNPYRPYGNPNPQHNPSNYGRWPHDMDDEDEHEKEEMQRLMINLRKIVLPQLEQVIAYILIPMIGSWIFKKLKIPAPTLPSVSNISFCRTCKLPVDLWQNPFIKL